MTHVLHTLRQAIKDGTPIDDSTPGILKIGSETYKLSDATGYFKKRGADQTAYDLDAIWFMWKHSDKKFTDYSHLCKEQNHVTVIYQDQTELRKWLNGEVDTLAGLKEETVEAPAQVEVHEEPAPVQEEEREQETREEHEPEEEHEEEEEQPPPAPVDRGPVVEYERIRPLDSVILCGGDFSDIATINQVIEKKEATSDDKHGEYNSFVRSAFEDPRPSGPMRNQKPIILVPMTAHSQVNNSNIEMFLTNGQWVQPVVDMSKKMFTIYHNDAVSLKTTAYEVVGDEKMLKPEDWARVVAIFLMGKAWQIKTYRPNDPAKLFSRILGIYVGWDNEGLPSDIANWRIKEFKINKTRRHADGQVVGKIWNEIEDATRQLKAKWKVK